MFEHGCGSPFPSALQSLSSAPPPTTQLFHQKFKEPPRLAWSSFPLLADIESVFFNFSLLQALQFLSRAHRRISHPPQPCRKNYPTRTNDVVRHWQNAAQQQDPDSRTIIQLEHPSAHNYLTQCPAKLAMGPQRYRHNSLWMRRFNSRNSRFMDDVLAQAAGTGSCLQIWYALNSPTMIHHW